MLESPTDYLHPHTLAALSGIDLRARMVVEGLMQGMHRSPLQGSSVEFAQHRQYAPGDDTRRLDWKVFGKTDKLYLKQFVQETNLDLLVMVDVSGSMSYSSAKPAWRKFDHAVCLAAAMAHLALRQRDRVALTVFDDQVRRATRMSNRRDHWRSIVEALSGIDLHTAEGVLPDAENVPGRADFARLFDTVTARLTQRSLLVLVSDMLDDLDVIERGLARLNHRGHDVVILQVMDPDELRFPFRMPSEFVGLEAEGRLNLDPEALRKGYLAALNEHLEGIERLARNFQFDYLLVDTSEPLGPALSHFLARRSSQSTSR